MSSPNSNGLHPEHHALLAHLAERIRRGEKTHASATLYLAEFDRVHNTQLAPLLDAFLQPNPPDLPKPPDSPHQAPTTKRARGQRTK
jgi:hypothetical protein